MVFSSSIIQKLLLFTLLIHLVTPIKHEIIEFNHLSQQNNLSPGRSELEIEPLNHTISQNDITTERLNNVTSDDVISNDVISNDETLNDSDSDDDGIDVIVTYIFLTIAGIVICVALTCCIILSCSRQRSSSGSYSDDCCDCCDEMPLVSNL